MRSAVGVVVVANKKVNKKSLEWVTCYLQPNIYTDSIYILVPPKFYMHKDLGAALKKGIELVQKKEKVKKK